MSNKRLPDWVLHIMGFYGMVWFPIILLSMIFWKIPVISVWWAIPVGAVVTLWFYHWIWKKQNQKERKYEIDISS